MSTTNTVTKAKVREGIRLISGAVAVAAVPSLFKSDEASKARTELSASFITMLDAFLTDLDEL